MVDSARDSVGLVKNIWSYSTRLDLGHTTNMDTTSDLHCSYDSWLNVIITARDFWEW